MSGRVVAGGIGVIGAPSSAGAFAPGQDDAPAALRGAGLIELLRDAGADVTDYGDVPGFRWVPDGRQPRAMHADVVRRIVVDVADRVAGAIADGRVALVLGGDCTVWIGTYLGVRRVRESPWLIYMDPHPDLNTPADNSTGALDWMGSAHLLGIPGALPALADLEHRPILTPDRSVLLGASDARSQPAERRVIATLGIRVFAESELAATANRALALVGGAPYAVHFDSDCIDFAELPICENTDRNIGLDHSTALTALGAAAAGPGLQAITVTEINPHHGARDGSTVITFTAGLTAALTGGDLRSAAEIA